MRKNLIFAAIAAIVFVFTSCSKLGPLSADNFEVTPNPLETQGGKVPATINGKFPEKYMKRNAQVTVIPELRYGNGQVAQGIPATFQGEKVMGNDQTISYRLGGHYTMKTQFDYVPEMQQSEMYLTFLAKLGKKQVAIPAVKVATGVIATSELYRQTMMNGGGCIAPDSFQRISSQKYDATVKFLVNQAVLRQSELKNNSVQEFVKLLQKINADRGEKLAIKNVEVAAYASPEGGFEFNDRLAGKRQDASEQYVQQTLKQTRVDAAVDARYTAQDWEGFQQLVQASNIQDKDVILRVLSMYKDPEQREQQIRNMSAAFRELADGILPELRRARMTINYDLVGRSDEQIKQQYATDATKLSVEEMLYAATLTDNLAEKEAIYKKTAQYWDKDYRALNNLAVLAFNAGDETKADQYLQQALRVNKKAPEAFANLGLMALKNGKLTEAEDYIANAIGANGFGEALGNLNIAKGNFAQAEANFAESVSNSAALAQLLNKNYEAAVQTLDKVKNPDAMTSYLHAIVAARRGNKFAAESYLKEALRLDSTLKNYADNDLEFQFLK
jgi:Flp pilus assembly protein TadD